MVVIIKYNIQLGVGLTRLHGTQETEARGSLVTTQQVPRLYTEIQDIWLCCLAFLSILGHFPMTKTDSRGARRCTLCREPHETCGLSSHTPWGLICCLLGFCRHLSFEMPFQYMEAIVITVPLKAEPLSSPRHAAPWSTEHPEALGVFCSVTYVPASRKS